ncbi:MAG: type II toxin-antitoxin system HicB family antitoxin [Planctomycetes bacterium]|nr:type II toxin-antitoxin system HicB family antitoxin [Planctomycetota bacterium]
MKLKHPPAALASETCVPVAAVVRGKRVRLHLHFDEDGGYWVDSPDMRGLVTQGDTTDEAIANGVDAALALLEADDILRKRKRA